MHISLTAALEAYVRRKVESGLYNNASEVIREALRERIRVEHIEAEDLEALRAQVMVGWEQAERGELAEWSAKDFIAELDRERRG
ncbi:MAG: type II toxin-antitoxin system ParD family antitoxin [Maricaulaceae bacterium]|nr:type II toxin-antitoxin system ParD family antitoxin [Maricaulaceae bacterium]